MLGIRRRALDLYAPQSGLKLVPLALVCLKNTQQSPMKRRSTMSKSVKANMKTFNLSDHQQRCHASN